MLDYYLEKVREPGQTINPVLSFLGVRIDEITKNKAVLALPIRDEFRHAGGFTAGGILATLADESMGHVVAANIEGNEGIVTIEMNIRYFKPVKSGEIRAEASIVKMGKKVVSVKADVKNESGDVLAQAGASFLLIDISSILESKKGEA